MSASSADWPGLRSARLTCRPLVPADVSRFHALVTRPEVGRMLFRFPSDWPLAEAASFIASVGWTGRLPFRLAIETDGLWLGWIGVVAGEVPDVVYALEPEASGKGHASEAVAAVAAFLFARFDVAALSAGVFADNPASMRVLEKAGFCRTGVAVHHSAARPGPAPCVQFRLDRPTA